MASMVRDCQQIQALHGEKLCVDTSFGRDLLDRLKPCRNKSF